MSAEGFNYDNLLMRMLNRFGDIMLLSVIFAFFSLPLFTIGASITALYYAGMKGCTLDGGNTFRYFWKSFKENFIQSTIIWALFLVVSFVFGVDIWFWFKQHQANGSMLSNVMLVISVMLMILNVFTLIYVFPLQAKFSNKTVTQIKNAFLLSIKYFPTTFLIMIILAVAAWGIYYQPPLVLSGMIFVGFGLMGYLFSYFMLKCFKPFLTEKEDEVNEDAIFVDEGHVGKVEKQSEDLSEDDEEKNENDKNDNEPEADPKEEKATKYASIAEKIKAASDISNDDE